MANTILTKNSGTATAVPSALSYGELALNYNDGKLFYKNATGAIVSLAGVTVTASGATSVNQKLDALTFNGSTTTFNLTVSGVAVTPANAASLIVSLNSVIKQPLTDFTVSGSTITFATAPAGGTTFFAVQMVAVLTDAQNAALNIFLYQNFS